MDHKDCGSFVQGCPPHNMYVMEAIAAGREKIAAKYAAVDGPSE
jgi:NADH:ubiquinone oxidoreductase subunit B-like Fe-S oxidoreductase